MKNINAKKVLIFDKNILYTWNNAHRHTEIPLKQVRNGFTKS